SSHSHTQSTYTIFISPFYASVLHQDLHSFPTRRSSDLTNQFATDGQTIFLAMRGKSDEPTLWDMRDLQRVFERFIKPFLKNVEFDSGLIPHRWWPRGKNHLVALDPRRSFGQPIVFRDGVPTSVLARSVEANGSVEEVARGFEIHPISVREAVEFERALAA